MGADLVEMQELCKENKGYRYMLNVIDVFSKYAWSIPLKDKKGTTVLDAFQKLLKYQTEFQNIFGLMKEKNSTIKILQDG